MKEVEFIISLITRFNKDEPGYLSRYSDGIWAGRMGFDSRQVQEHFLFSTVSRPARGPTKTPTHWVPGLFPWGKSAGK
jgi:hypothetical protein